MSDDKESGKFAKKEYLGLERKYRYHDDPHHKSNWCGVCGLYYCWHPEVEGHRNDSRAMHKFIPILVIE